MLHTTLCIHGTTNFEARESIYVNYCLPLSPLNHDYQAKKNEAHSLDRDHFITGWNRNEETQHNTSSGWTAFEKQRRHARATAQTLWTLGNSAHYAHKRLALEYHWGLGLFRLKSLCQRDHKWHPSVQRVRLNEVVDRHVTVPHILLYGSYNTSARKLTAEKHRFISGSLHLPLSPLTCYINTLCNLQAHSISICLLRCVCSWFDIQSINCVHSWTCARANRLGSSPGSKYMVPKNISWHLPEIYLHVLFMSRVASVMTCYVTRQHRFDMMAIACTFLLDLWFQAGA